MIIQIGEFTADDDVDLIGEVANNKSGGGLGLFDWFGRKSASPVKYSSSSSVDPSYEPFSNDNRKDEKTSLDLDIPSQAGIKPQVLIMSEVKPVTKPKEAFAKPLPSHSTSHHPATLGGSFLPRSYLSVDFGGVVWYMYTRLVGAEARWKIGSVVIPEKVRASVGTFQEYPYTHKHRQFFKTLCADILRWMNRVEF